MREFVLSIGAVSLGTGILLLLQPVGALRPAVRMLTAVTLLVMLVRLLPGVNAALPVLQMPEVSAEAFEKEVEQQIAETYTDHLSGMIRERAGENAKVFITLFSDGSIDTVTVYGAENIVGLRAFVEESLSPREVNIYGEEEN